MHSRVLQMQEEGQSPSLGDIMRFRIQLRQRITILRLRRINSLPRKVRHLRDLIREHLIHGLFLEDAIPTRRVLAVVEQRGDYLHVLIRDARNSPPRRRGRCRRFLPSTSRREAVY